MPCYNPPYDDESTIGLQATARVDRYSKQLADIEQYCKDVLLTDAHGSLHHEAVKVAEAVIEMIHAPWRDGRAI